MSQKLFFLLFFSAFLISCSDYIPVNKEILTDQLLHEGTIIYDFREISKSMGDCQPETEGCTFVRIKYMIFSLGALKEKANPILTSYVKDSIWSANGKSNENMTMLVENFFENSSNMKAGITIPGIAPYIKISSEMKGQSEKYMVMSTVAETYTRGNHPEMKVKYHVFDKETGELVTLDKIFKPGYEAELNKAIDSEFRRVKHLKPFEPLNERGGLRENKIECNNNFWICEDFIEFLYNENEIAEHAGMQKIRIPTAKLEKFMNP